MSRFMEGTGAPAEALAAWLLALTTLLPAQRPAQATEPKFEDVAAAAGVAVRHHPPVFDSKLAHIMPMVSAGAAGAAIGDINNDGYADIFVNDARLGSRNHLFLNNRDGTFTDIAAKAGVADLNTDNQVSSGGIFFDYDGDGYEDLLVLRFGQPKLFRNRHDGTFEDVTERAHLTKRTNAVAAVAFDADGDGYLDIYIGSYFPDVNLFDLDRFDVLHDSWEQADNGGSNVFYHNNGDGTFSDQTAAAGLVDTGWTMAVAHGDFDGDGWQDVYVANDYGPDHVYRNLRNGRFENVSKTAIGIDTKKGMNAEVADFDNDGNMDIFVTNVTEDFLHECNMLWKNDGTGRFTDVAQELGVCDTGWSWGGKFFDYDNDGYQDLYVASGFFKGSGDYLDVLLPALWEGGEDPSDARKWPPTNGMGIASNERNVLETNLGGKRFRRETASGLEVARTSRAIVLADFNNDGRMDLFLTNQDDDAMLFMNETKTANHWLEVDLVGRKPNTHAVGARVVATTGTVTMTREVNCGNGFGGGSTVRQHFGLGDRAIVDRLTVRWPNGEMDSFAAVAADRIVRITQGEKRVMTAPYFRKS